MKNRATIFAFTFLAVITLAPASASAQTFPSDIIEDIIRRFLGVDNARTPIGVTDGNPNAATAVLAADAFSVYGLHPLLGRDPKNFSNNYAWRATVDFGQIETDIIDGHFIALSLSQGWRFTDRIALAFSAPIQFRDTEGAQVLITGGNAGLPITLIRERNAKGLSWGVTPWAVGGVGVSDELDQGALVYGTGFTSSLSLRGKFIKLTLANQICYIDGSPFEYGSFFNNEQPISQTIVKHGLSGELRVGPLFIDGSATHTELLDGGFVDEWWTPAAGVGIKVGRNGLLRVGYQSDIADDYETQSLRAILQFAI